LLQVEDRCSFCLEDEEFKKARDKERALRVPYLWRKESVPNHLLHVLYLQDYYALNRNMKRPPRKTVQPQDMALSWPIN
jgi:hypothetical protein